MADIPPNPGHSNPPPRRRAHHALLFRPRRRIRGWWIAAIVGTVVIATAGAIGIVTAVDWTTVMQVIAGLDAVPLIAAMSTLPLLGFPILPVYLVAGARFGPYGGGAVVVLVTVVHLVGSYAIARTVLRQPLQRLLARWHLHLPHIPSDEEAAVAFVAALVPGLPYVIRTYLFAVAGLRLRVCFWIALPIYVARSYVSILLGDLGMAPSTMRLIILGSVEAVKVAICALVIWWLREHHRRVHGDTVAAAPPSGEAR